MRALRITIAAVMLTVTAGQGQAAFIGIYGNNSNSAITSFLTGSGDTVVDLNATGMTDGTLTGLDSVILLRSPGNSALRNFVLNGGRLVTEWDASIWALNTANLLQATDTNINSVHHTGTLVSFTPLGVAAGLSAAMNNPYSNGSATEFFRIFSNVGPGITLATSPYGAAILGGVSGAGNTVIIGYDWADSFSSANLDGKQVLLNALAFDAQPRTAITPEPTSLALAGFAGIGMAAGAWRRRQQQAA